MSRASTVNHAEARRKLRRKLEARGEPPEVIEQKVNDLLQRQGRGGRLVAARALGQQSELDRIVEEREKADARPVVMPDDSRYRPAAHDSTLVGAARAVGQTAKAVRRQKTITKWQYDQAEAAGASGSVVSDVAVKGEK